MDVDNNSYWDILPTVLDEISSSKCVSFDLELSGIPQKLRQKSVGRQTLQERYLEIKHAAETYFIVQFGITCINEDLNKEMYTLRSFNFDISPMVPEYLGIDRTFAYSSGALDFLLAHGHEVQKPILEGIPYLKVSECNQARALALARLDRSSIPDIDLAKQDAATIKFIERVRTELASWEKSYKHKMKSHTVFGTQTSDGQFSEPGVALTSFQRRLVHQIVRADFPDYQTFGKAGGGIEVKIKNPEADAKICREMKMKQNSNVISKQIGFRFIAEALAGREMDELDINHCQWQIQGKRYGSLPLFMTAMDDIKRTLTQGPKILVGHNCFLDLVYFYSHFLGDLPDTVEEFAQTIHAIFPLLIDTKFMATADPAKADFWNSSLNDIERVLSYQEYPRLEQSSSGPRYVGGNQYHKAGYDSFVTMEVFLKLAARMHADARMARGIVPNSTLNPPVGRPDLPHRGVALHEARETTDMSHWERSSNKTKRMKKKSRSSGSELQSSGKFFHANPFAQLDGLSQNSDDEVVVGSSRVDQIDGTPVNVQPVHPSAETPISSSNAMTKDDTVDVAILAQPTIWASHLIPRWEDEFWKPYVNKLRVYGTVEQECDLTMEPKAAVGTTNQASRPAGWVGWHLGRLAELLRRLAGQ